MPVVKKQIKQYNLFTDEILEGADTEAETTLHKAVPKNFKGLVDWLPKASYAGDGHSLTS